MIGAFVLRCCCDLSAPLNFRNVPYVLDEAELKDYFAQFGAVRYCRAVFDPETGMSRGKLLRERYQLRGEVRGAR